MIIHLTPMRRDDSLAVSVTGETLTINGAAYDFGPLAEGATLPRAAVDCVSLASDVTRTDGQIVLTLVLPHGPDAPAAMLYPAPIHVTADGPVALPSQPEEVTE